MPVIITDSTCDIALSELDALGVLMLSLRVNFGAESFEDKRTITNEEFFKRLQSSKELPTTSLISVGQFAEVFEKYPHDDIIVITISQTLSGTYQSAVLASEESGRQNIYCIDTESVSIGHGLIVKLAAKYRDEGLNAPEIAEKLKKHIAKLRMFGVVDTLEYLVKGGRITGVQGVIGNLLSLKPLLTIDHGVIKNFAKARGIRAAVSVLAETVAKGAPVNAALPAAIAYAGNIETMRMIEDALGFPGPDSEYYMGSVVGTHAGPNSVLLAYFID